MVASASILEAGEKLLEGIPVLTSERNGRYSTLQRIALRARKVQGSVAGFADLLGLTAQELVTLYYEPIYSLRPVQVPPSTYRTFFFMGAVAPARPMGERAQSSRRRVRTPRPASSSSGPPTPKS